MGIVLGLLGIGIILYLFLQSIFVETGDSDADEILKGMAELSRTTHEIAVKNMDYDFTEEQNRKFEDIWKRFYVDHEFESRKELSDDEYILFRRWEDIHIYDLHDKYFSSMIVFGRTPNLKGQIIFHGGCLGCVSQEKYGLDRCKGCQYFKAEWDKPNLSITK